MVVRKFLRASSLGIERLTVDALRPRSTRPSTLVLACGDMMATVLLNQ
jgi:hypothetical protein